MNVREIRAKRQTEPLDIVLIQDSKAMSNYTDAVGYFVDRIGEATSGFSGQYIVILDEDGHPFSYSQGTQKDFARIQGCIEGPGSLMLAGEYLITKDDAIRLRKYDGASLGEGDLAFRVCAAAYDPMTQGVETCFVSAKNINEACIEADGCAVVVNDKLKGFRRFGRDPTEWLCRDQVESLDTESMRHYFYKI